VRLAGECPPNHVGIACGRCEDGYWDNAGECTKCGTRHFAVLICVGTCLGMLLAFAIYRFTGHETPERFTAPVLLTCTVGLALRFAQFLAVFSTFNREMPRMVQDTSATMSFALGSPPALSADCFAGTSFQAQYTQQAVRPLVIASFFFGNWALSVVLNRATGGLVKRMSFDHTCNVCGMVLASLYVGLCKVSISYFECVGHAAAPDTLLQFPSVVCNSDEHMSMAALGYLAVAVWMIGMLALAVYVSIRAPAMYRNSPSFRVRFRFLFSRWRPDKWYFGAVYMLRDALVLLVAVMAPKDSVVELSLMLIFLALPMVAVALHWPWRDNRTNYVDMVMTLGLCAFIALSLKFVTNTEADTTRGTSGAIGFCMVLLLGTVAGTVFVAVAYSLFLIQNRSKVESTRMEALSGLAGKYVDLGNVLVCQDPEDLANILDPCTAVDLQDLARVFRLVKMHCNDLESRSPPYSPDVEGTVRSPPRSTSNVAASALKRSLSRQSDKSEKSEKSAKSGKSLTASVGALKRTLTSSSSGIWTLGASPTSGGTVGLYEAAARGIVLSPRSPRKSSDALRGASGSDLSEGADGDDRKLLQDGDAGVEGGEPNTLLRTLRTDAQPGNGHGGPVTTWV